MARFERVARRRQLNKEHRKDPRRKGEIKISAMIDLVFAERRAEKRKEMEDG